MKGNEMLRRAWYAVFVYAGVPRSTIPFSRNGDRQDEHAGNLNPSFLGAFGKPVKFLP